MNIFLTLELIGLLLSQTLEQRPTREQHPMLYRVLDAVGLKHIMEHSDNARQSLLERLRYTMGFVESRLAYYESQELKTCFALEQYLTEVFDNLGNGSKESPKTLAMMICAMGNKSISLESSAAVGVFIEEARHLVRQITDDTDQRGEELDFGYHSFLVSNLMYIDKVLELVDVFSTTQQGMIAGVEEYAPVDENFLNPIPVPDFVTGTCSGETTCECGCQLDHPVLIVEGLEDLLNGQSKTYAARYTLGVCAARSDRFLLVTGVEGEVFDTIKELGKKALDALMETFEAIKESIDPEDEEKKAEQVTEIAENNKKALQAIKNKSLTINDAAKNGILSLADTSDPSGKMKRVVAKLNTVSTAAGVIDGLLGVMKTEVSTGSEASKAYKDAKTALDDLKNTSPKGDETNKEVAALAKEAMQAKVAAAKEAMKELRKKVGEHNKRFSGIKKAISGISPHIFPDPDKKEDEKKEA